LLGFCPNNIVLHIFDYLWNEKSILFAGAILIRGLWICDIVNVSSYIEQYVYHRRNGSFEVDDNKMVELIVRDLPRSLISNVLITLSQHAKEYLLTHINYENPIFNLLISPFSGVDGSTDNEFIEEQEEERIINMIATLHQRIDNSMRTSEQKPLKTILNFTPKYHDDEYLSQRIS
jgi:hypothetical protein